LYSAIPREPSKKEKRGGVARSDLEGESLTCRIWGEEGDYYIPTDMQVRKREIYPQPSVIYRAKGLEARFARGGKEGGGKGGLFGFSTPWSKEGDFWPRGGGGGRGEGGEKKRKFLIKGQERPLSEWKKPQKKKKLLTPEREY